MILFPAIDLRGGRVVRLEQGRAEAETVYSADPVHVAQGFQKQGATHLHLVDLDAAFSGRPSHLPIVREIAAATAPALELELGGGLRSLEAIEAALAAGVTRAVIGTRACESLEFVAEAVAHFGAARLAVGLDARDGVVSTRGWTAPSTWLAPELARAVCQCGVTTLIYTDIATDGMGTGPNLPALRELSRAVPAAQIIASGGIAQATHITELCRFQPPLAGAIIGKALYDGKVSLPDLLAAVRAAG